ATDCIFARYVGEALGLEIEDGISRAFRTLSGSFTAYGHNVTLSAGGLAPFDCLVYFTAHEGRRNYLGRNGWLNRVRAGLVRYEGLLYPGLYDEYLRLRDPELAASCLSMKINRAPLSPNRTHFESLVREFRELEEKLRQGGGPDKIERQHQQKKLTARERIALLLDEGSRFQEIGLLVAYDEYDGQAPSAGVVIGFGLVAGREVVVVANDATVKAGSWWPETIKKMLRAQEIAMRCRTPIIYMVDSAGVNLPYQGGVFPGQYGAARIFYYNSIMRRYLKVPQIAAVMGPCIAGGAYLPALSDVIIMVEGTSFMGL